MGGQMQQFKCDCDVPEQVNVQHGRRVLCYPPSFDGWLCAVFYAYEYKCVDAALLIAENDYQPTLFDDKVSVVIDEGKAARVMTWLSRHFGVQTRLFLWAWLSELACVGMTMFGVVRYAIANPKLNILSDYSHRDVVALHQVVKSVGREKHRMEAFVRFEKLKDEVFFARIAPDFNVLPLIASHFKQRYQDQAYVIYDTKRGYGLYHAHAGTYETIVEVDEALLANPKRAWSDDEARYQEFWQGYFYHVNIRERANPRLHRQYLPKRYWQYLSEKQIRGDETFLKKRRESKKDANSIKH